MTIAYTSSTRQQFSGPGTLFSCTFGILSASDVTVTTKDSSGNVATLMLTTDYTISNITSSSFDCTLVSSLPASSTLTIFLNIPTTQLTDYVNGIAFNAETVETSFDRSTLQIKQLQEADARRISVPEESSITNSEIPLASLQAGYLLRINAAGDGFDTLASTIEGAPINVLTPTNGIIVQDTTAPTFVARTITGTAAEITVTNGSGVSGNPTLSLPSAMTFTGKVVTGGTIQTATLGNCILSGKDTETFIKDDADATKVARFECSAISTSTTRTFTFPNANGTLALTSNVPAVASSAEMVTGTENGKFVSPLVAHHHKSAAKAWGYITVSAGTPSLTSSYNVTSVVDGGVGIVQINLTTAFASTTSYSLVGNVDHTAGAFYTATFHNAASNFYLRSYDANAAAQDPVNYNFAAFGTQ